MSQRTVLTADNICDDDLWAAAAIDVQGDRESWAEISPRDYAYYKEVMAAIRNNDALEIQYSGILECQFENYDCDH